MPRHQITTFALALLMSCAAWINASAADEFKVIDAFGLTRAVKDTQGSVEVVVSLTSNKGSPATLVLSNVDGLSSDIPGTLEQPGKFRFKGIQKGTWRITSQNGDYTIQEVRIK